jgi:hypothetical protein
MYYCNPGIPPDSLFCPWTLICDVGRGIDDVYGVEVWIFCPSLNLNPDEGKKRREKILLTFPDLLSPVYSHSAISVLPSLALLLLFSLVSFEIV